MSRTPFSEGFNPLDERRITYVSNSIDTSAVDPYRQGVELTLDKYFQQGIAKIWSGNDGHQINVIDIGQRDDDIYAEQDFYLEVAPFDPVLYLTDYFMTQVIVIDSPVNTNENGFDGIIEPLSIRRVVSFTSIDVPFEAHSVKGSLEVGNYDPFRNSDAIVSKQRFSELSLGTHSYEDNVDMTGETPTNLGFWPTISTRLKAFDDSQLKDGVMMPVVVESRMRESLQGMAPPTESYLSQDFVSTAASLYTASDYYTPRQTSLYDPSELPLTAWWRGYSSAPWGGSVSTGNSHVHAMLTAGADPTVSTLNGRNIASFNGSSQYLQDNVSTSTNDYINRTSYTYVVLGRFTSPSSPNANIYNNRAFLGDFSSNFAIVYSTLGIAVHHYSSPDYYQTEWLAADPGWHFIAATYQTTSAGADAASATGVLTLYVDGRMTTVSNVPPLSAANAFRVGQSWSSNFLTGDIAEVMISKSVLTRDQLNTIRRRYFNPIYNLSV